MEYNGVTMLGRAQVRFSGDKLVLPPKGVTYILKRNEAEMGIALDGNWTRKPKWARGGK